MNAFVELQIGLINAIALDLSSVPIFPIASYTVLPFVLGWLEMCGLDPRFLKTLPLELRLSEDDNPPWLCTIEYTNHLVSRSVTSRRIFQGMRHRDFLGQGGANLRGLVIAKAGKRVVWTMPRATSQETGQDGQEREEGQVKVERVIAFWQREYLV